ncbi:hypothetical protein N5079_19600 [Planotetraspora sp. A-T 1434]|uniref:hypothetical protein n=1 Tax=Planotetraspora sp. A-T 1434 TaxID=2979219 RepID=UPI0021BE3FCB|nr:hypothetical protein [Planotetraspora sp. A-T 1434]MCT9932409.1 hypothetical protein [Planotetraspora sp. A-T 1434]
MAKTRAELHPTDCLPWSVEPVTVRAEYQAWLEALPKGPRPVYQRRPEGSPS